MHELYLWPFQDAVKSGVASVMCSYNRINGSYACQNSKTLNGLLKEELGFQGKNLQARGRSLLTGFYRLCDVRLGRHAFWLARG